VDFSAHGPEFACTPGMPHISHDTLARYLIHTDSENERMRVDWHLEHCPICKEEISVRDMVIAARKARERMVVAIRSAALVGFREVLSRFPAESETQKPKLKKSDEMNPTPGTSFSGTSEIRNVTTRFRLILQHALNFLFQHLGHDRLG
jgi:hypothetical protein